MKHTVHITPETLLKSKYLGKCALEKTLFKMFPKATKIIVSPSYFKIHFKDKKHDIKREFDACQLESHYHNDFDLGDLLYDMHFTSSPEPIIFNFITY